MYRIYIRKSKSIYSSLLFLFCSEEDSRKDEGQARRILLAIRHESIYSSLSCKFSPLFFFFAQLECISCCFFTIDFRNFRICYDQSTTSSTWGNVKYLQCKLSSSIICQSKQLRTNLFLFFTQTQFVLWMSKNFITNFSMIITAKNRFFKKTKDKSKIERNRKIFLKKCLN